MQQYSVSDGSGQIVRYTYAEDMDEVAAVTHYLSEDSPVMVFTPFNHPHPNGAQIIALSNVRSWMERREVEAEAHSV